MNCSCGKRLVRNDGKPTNPCLLVVLEPDWQDVKNGMFLSGNSGNALKVLMNQIGLPFPKYFYATGLWKHAPDKTEFDSHALELSKIMYNYKYIILSGSGLSSEILGCSDSEWWGINIPKGLLPREYFDRKKVKFVTTIPAPGSLLVMGIGETKLALEKFKKGVVR